MKKTIKKLTAKDIAREKFDNEKGQHCALGWINHYTDTKDKNCVDDFKSGRTRTRVAKNLQRIANIKSESKMRAGDIICWNDRRRTSKTFIADSLNKAFKQAGFKLEE